MTAVLIWHPDLAAYDLGERHPMNPLRLTLSVELMDAYGLLKPGVVVPPRQATESELLLAHTNGYIEAVQEASAWGAGLQPNSGLGTEDNPIFPGMHEVAALACGASIVAMEQVVSGEHARAFSIAGGLHHAHRAKAAGFSVYNDAAVAISRARQERPDLRVLYIDIDAHHGDGVQECFYGSSEVMTISLHESGLTAYPGTGFPSELGYGGGEGFAVNVPLPAGATDDCFRIAFDEAIEPVALAFRPDVVVAQLGIDAHYADPQTDLGLTLPGYRDLVRRIIAIADATCEGRLVALGGGGYHIVEIVPRAWTWVMAELLGVQLDDELPAEWRDLVCRALGIDAPRSLGDADTLAVPADRRESLLSQTRDTIAEVRRLIFPFHGLRP